MTLGSSSVVSEPGAGGSVPGEEEEEEEEENSCYCSCCGAKMLAYFTEDTVETHNHINQLISESFLTVKGAALFLPRGNSPSPNSNPAISQRRNTHTGDLQEHLQTVYTVLRPEDHIRLAVRLESVSAHCTRYMVVVSTNGRQDTEESVVLGVDFSSDSSCTVGLVLPLWSDTLIHLDGDGGFSVSTVNRVHIFKPVSVQAMWSALQSLHKACEVARCHNYYPGSLSLSWVAHYHSRLTSDQLCINEWNAMRDVQSHRADSPVLYTHLPTERERTERLINIRLREIMMQKDLENITSKEIRTELEMQMVCDLQQFKEYIDNQMIVILGQMDSPTQIFEHVYLGSEWNASNLEELQNSGVRYILNVSREIDNFFPGMFEYHNIRVYDEETTNLLEHWNDTYKFISKAKKEGAKVLVHCKMGVSRSASTVMAYAMKEYGWDLDSAHSYVKERRGVAKPNPAFMKQLEEYQGILLASKQRHNKLWRSHCDSDLSDQPSSHTPSLHHFLGVAVVRCQEDPLGPPRAAMLLPEDQTLDNNCPVSCPATLPRPPPPPESSLHILPPPPQPPRGGPRAVRLSTTVPECRPVELFLDLPERSDGGSEEPVVSPPPPLSLGSCGSPPALSLGSSGSPPALSLGSSGSPPALSLGSCGSPPALSLGSCGSPPALSLGSSGSPHLSLGSTDSGSTLPYTQSDRLSPAPSPAPMPPVSPATPPPALWGVLLTTPGPKDHNNNNQWCTEEQGEEEEEKEEEEEEQDSIDFFSAREKFLGLAPDRRTRGTAPLLLLSEQARPGSFEDPPGERASKEEEEELGGTMSQKSAPCGLDVQSSDDISDRPRPGRAHHHDSGVSVRHIVTEIESISHPSPSSSHAPSPSSSSSLRAPPPATPAGQLDEEEEEEEDRETGEVVRGSLGPPSPPCFPPLSCDWPAGSVRRAAEQLELRLRQEVDKMAAAQRSPVHSPTTSGAGEHHPPTCSPPRSPSARSPPPPLSGFGCFGHRPTQGAESPSPSAVVKKDKDGGGETRAGSDPDPRAPPNDPSPVADASHRKDPRRPRSDSNACVAAQSAVGAPRRQGRGNTPTSAERAHAPPPGPSSSYSGPNAPGAAPRPSGPIQSRSESPPPPLQELEKIRRTLRELQAFLFHEAGGPETTGGGGGGGGGGGEEETTTAVGRLEEAHTDRPGGIHRPERSWGAREGPPESTRGSRDAPMDTEGKRDGRNDGPETQVLRGSRDRCRQGRSLRQWSRCHWLMDLESRLRQAGLTPPSLLKRSASLAKLDRLELCASDLTARDPQALRTPRADPQSRPYVSTPDDIWKKQRVLGSADETPTSSSSCSSRLLKQEEETGEEEEEVFNNGMVAMATGGGQGSRGSTRKSSTEKKTRTAVTVLYHTM